jgi:hypothetical protein
MLVPIPKLSATRIAPATVRLSKSLIQHIDMKASDPVGKLFCDDLLHRFQVPRVEAKPPQGIPVRVPHLPLWVLLEKMTGLLDDCVRNDGQSMFRCFFERIAKRIAIAKARRLWQEL